MDKNIIKETMLSLEGAALQSARNLIADGRDAGAHSAFGRRYLKPIECMSKGNF